MGDQNDMGRLARAESLVASLDGIVRARFVADENGTIEEIHVLSEAGTSGKQTARNIESALLAELGLDIDHRKISIAHLKPDQQRPQSAPDGADPVKEGDAGSRAAFQGFELHRRRGEKVVCRVHLVRDGEEYVGEATAADSPSTRLTASAEAALEALRSVPRAVDSVAAEAVERHRVLDREVVVAVVLVRSRRETVALSGAALVKDSVEEAAVFASLDATNRWVTRSTASFEGEIDR